MNEVKTFSIELFQECIDMGLEPTQENLEQLQEDEKEFDDNAKKFIVDCRKIVCQINQESFTLDFATTEYLESCDALGYFNHALTQISSFDSDDILSLRDNSPCFQY